MANGAPVKERKREPTQFRLTPRIADELAKRKAAHGSTVTHEAEGLIDKGLMLERMMGQRDRSAMDILLRLLDNDPEGALRKMLEYGADHRRLENVIKTYRLNAGIDPMPDFKPLTPGDRQ